MIALWRLNALLFDVLLFIKKRIKHYVIKIYFTDKQYAHHFNNMVIRMPFKLYL